MSLHFEHLMQMGGVGEKNYQAVTELARLSTDSEALPFVAARFADRAVPGRQGWGSGVEGGRVVAQVGFDEAGDEVVAVVVARLQAQRQRMPRCGAGRLQALRLELGG